MKEADVIPLNTTESPRIVGKIIKLKEEEGWGFIVSPSLKFTRVFFHWSDLLAGKTFPELVHEDQVEFNYEKSYDKDTGDYMGLKAVKIKVLT